METDIKYIHKPEVHNSVSPEKVVPILIEMFNPRSILDVGCGIGTWLHSFARRGITDLIGVDGDYVDRTMLAQYLDIKKFQPIDLTNPFDLKRKFDLVISLEVAEHLPESSADGFVRTLIRHSDLIAFSAAIPGQGGQNHLNEQWKQYWIEKFALYNFMPFDLIRPKIWNIKEIDWWYKQNMIIFSNRNLAYMADKNSNIMEAVHPQLLHHHLEYITYLQEYVKTLENKIYS